MASDNAMLPKAKTLRIIVLGAGGREHAIVVHLLKSKRVEHVYVAPGNGGTGTIDAARCSNLTDVKAAGDFKEIAQWSKANNINLCIPGPEQPLVDGVEAAFREVGIAVFGPTPFAAQMEGSKDFAKAFMARHDIPTAQFRAFEESQVQDCLAYVKELGGAQKIVLKASGLAAGKGVLLPETDAECEQGIKEILVEKVFGDAGSTLLVEQRLNGPELSVLTFSDGYSYYSLPSCQDHKRIGEGDTGPNTGGMGAYSPAPEGKAPGVERAIEEQVIAPTIAGMRKDGFPFVGLLFTGFMVTERGPEVLEYNVRFGDPETEAALELLDIENGPTLADIIEACTERRLDALDIKLKNDSHAVSVVLASGGYPGRYATGKKITIGSLPEGVSVYHAGTKMQGQDLVTAGGRVLAVSASGSTLQAAVELAYKGVEQISFEGMTLRKDIAHRALRPAKSNGMPGLTYAAAGVDVDAGNDLVEAIKSYAKSTARPGCDAKLGGFGGVFDLKAAGQYRDPLLVSGTDGVGTKLRVAQDHGKHDTVGIDLVAMSVNDLLVQAAAPLYFLDYFACSKLHVETAANVVKGIADGCRQSNCGLVGGETAEMPGMYVGDDYDLAGFAVGVVERSNLLPKLEAIKVGDVLLGLRSSGLHSNGFSLVRKVLERANVKYADKCPWKEDASMSIGDRILEPTRVYVKALTGALGLDGKSAPSPHIKALSHITGGGFTDNIPRILPKGFGAEVDLTAWKRPEVFAYLQEQGNVEPLEMCRTLNNGIGMVLIVDQAGVEEVLKTLQADGEQDVVRMGSIVTGEGVSYKGIASWQH
jgi:phosphoribosylamine--glycine ligase/phosphoribosylformylglycinamidine cyclo-ligase